LSHMVVETLPFRTENFKPDRTNEVGFR
jgi:hypothetical protein